MDIACMLYHGPRADAPVEVMRYPHMELLGTDERERTRLRVLADQLEHFGRVPYSYKEMASTDGGHQGTVLRIALQERAGDAPR